MWILGVDTIVFPRDFNSDYSNGRRNKTRCVPVLSRVISIERGCGKERAGQSKAVGKRTRASAEGCVGKWTRARVKGCVGKRARVESCVVK